MALIIIEILKVIELPSPHWSCGLASVVFSKKIWILGSWIYLMRIHIFFIFLDMRRLCGESSLGWWLSSRVAPFSAEELWSGSPPFLEILISKLTFSYIWHRSWLGFFFCLSPLFCNRFAISKYALTKVYFKLQPDHCDDSSPLCLQHPDKSAHSQVEIREVLKNMEI